MGPIVQMLRMERAPRSQGTSKVLINIWHLVVGNLVYVKGFHALSCSSGYAQRSNSEDSGRLKKVCDSDFTLAPLSSLGTRSPPCALGNREGNVSQPASGDGLGAAL